LACDMGDDMKKIRRRWELEKRRSWSSRRGPSTVQTPALHVFVAAYAHSLDFIAYRSSSQFGPVSVSSIRHALIWLRHACWCPVDTKHSRTRLTTAVIVATMVTTLSSGGTGSSLARAAVIVAGVSSLVATLLSLVYEPCVPFLC
jgi:hypothetical protein